MNHVWNLDKIYAGFDDPAFSRDLSELKQAVTRFGTFTDNLPQADPATALADENHTLP